MVAYSSRNPPELLSGQLITGAKLRSCLEPDLELNTIIDDPSLAYANTDPWEPRPAHSRESDHEREQMKDALLLGKK